LEAVKSVCVSDHQYHCIICMIIPIQDKTLQGLCSVFSLSTLWLSLTVYNLTLKTEIASKLLSPQSWCFSSVA